MNVPETFFSVPEELRLLMLSIAAGVPLGMCRDTVRALRLILPHNKLLTAAEDVLLLAGYALFLSFFASCAARGHMRLYYLVGNALGFTIYSLTLGRAMMSALEAVLRLILKPFSLAFVLLTKKIIPFFVYSNNLLVIYIKKAFFLLRKYAKVVYNKTENIKRRNVKRVGEKNKA